MTDVSEPIGDGLHYYVCITCCPKTETRWPR
jgi:hypothetical protein